MGRATTSAGWRRHNRTPAWIWSAPGLGILERSAYAYLTAGPETHGSGLSFAGASRVAEALGLQVEQASRALRVLAAHRPPGLAGLPAIWWCEAHGITAVSGVWELNFGAARPGAGPVLSTAKLLRVPRWACRAWEALRLSLPPAVVAALDPVTVPDYCRLAAGPDGAPPAASWGGGGLADTEACLDRLAALWERYLLGAGFVAVPGVAEAARVLARLDHPEIILATCAEHIPRGPARQAAARIVARVLESYSGGVPTPERRGGPLYWLWDESAYALLQGREDAREIGGDDEPDRVPRVS